MLLEHEPLGSFHLHAQTFDVYPAGMGERPASRDDTLALGMAQRAILEFTLPTVGRYMFHPHQHWLAERAINIALLLLGSWLVASLLLLPDFSQRTLLEWLRPASGAVPMALLIVIAFRHALDGMKVIVDDYVEDEGNRFVVNTLLLFLAVGGGALALFAVARIAFGAIA